MKFAILVMFLFSTLTTSCQSIKNLSVTKNISETNFELNDEKFRLVKLSIENQTKEDLVLWIAQNKESDLKQYLLKNQGDFNLLDLISEKILKPDNQIVFKSFIKILSAEEKFNFTILMDNPDKQKVALSKKFIEDYFKYESVEKLSKLITEENYKKSSYKGDEMVLPYGSIVD